MFINSGVIKSFIYTVTQFETNKNSCASMYMQKELKDILLSEIKQVVRKHSI